MKGREELTGPRPLGNWLLQHEDGRVTILRGKFAGAYFNTVPAGYIGRFLLQKCRDELNPRELELCEKYAGDSAVKKIRRRVRMTETSKVQVEVTAGKGIAEAFDKAAEVGCAEISLNIPVPKSHQEPTALDKLRMRGTPLELISSYLIADTHDMARQAFRSCVLEHVYERLAEKYHATVVFEGRDVLTSTDSDDLMRDTEGEIGIAITPENEKTIENRKTPVAPIAKIETGERVSPVADSLQATVLGAIESISQSVETFIEMPVKRVLDRLGDGHLTFGIITDLSLVQLDTNPEHTKITTSGRIVLYAHFVK